MGEMRVLIHTDEFDKSVEFYGGLLQLPVTVQWGADEHQGRGIIYAATSDGRIELLEGGPPPQGLTVSLQTQDVEAVAARLGESLKQPPTDQPWGHRNCAAVDPNGITVVFFQVLGQPE
jgi:catechol 2,3-dioxygenase-like lactoylglutathione lyase family enzyme